MAWSPLETRQYPFLEVFIWRARAIKVEGAARRISGSTQTWYSIGNESIYIYEQGRVSNLILDIEDFLPIGSKDIEVGGDGLGRQWNKCPLATMIATANEFPLVGS